MTNGIKHLQVSSANSTMVIVDSDSKNSKKKTKAFYVLNSELKKIKRPFIKNVTQKVIA